MYCWADGVHFSIRLGDQGRLCCLVIVGVRAAVACAPVVMGAGAVAGAARGLPRHPRAARYWQHAVRNMLGAPKSVHGGARKALNEIILVEDRTHAERAIDAFAADYSVKRLKAVAKVTGETEQLLCFFNYPAEHWLQLRTTNPIQSSFPPVRARTRVTKGARVQGHWAGDGVQAAAGRRRPLAGGQRPHRSPWSGPGPGSSGAS